MLPRAERLQRLKQLTDAEAESLVHDWKWWGRPNQQLPTTDFSTWLIMAGRGYGKTRTGAETVRTWVKDNRIVNIAGPTSFDVRNVMIEGPGGILSVCPNNERPLYEPAKRKLTWPNGAVSLCFSADEPERFRGPQQYKFWADELAAWQYQDEAWDQSQFGLRLGANPQAIVTTTPKPTKLIKQLVKAKTTVVTGGSTYENRANLSAKFFQHIITKYEGTRLGQQELLAQLLDDNPSALWSRATIDRLRVSKLIHKLTRIVIGVDPAVSANATSDDTGIVAVGMDDQWPPHFYVLDDDTGIYKPLEWAQKVSTMYHKHGADRVIGEVNNGGDLVEANLRTKDLELSYKAVHATRNKTRRAEPIAALYEQGRVHHVGYFAPMEDEMCDYDPSLPPDAQRSPNRMDALVWALWELAGLWKPEPVVEDVMYHTPVTVSQGLDDFDMEEMLNGRGQTW